MNKERKIIVTIGIILLLVGAIYRFFPAVDNILPDTESVAVKRNQIEKMHARISRKGKLQNELFALNRELAQVESIFLSGETPALSAVEIQNTLNEIAETSRVNIDTMRVLPPPKPEEEGNHLFAVPVQITMTCNIRQFKEMIFRIENSDTFLAISEIRVRLNSILQLDKIQSTLTVEGIMKDS